MMKKMTLRTALKATVCAMVAATALFALPGFANPMPARAAEPQPEAIIIENLSEISDGYDASGAGAVYAIDCAGA